MRLVDTSAWVEWLIGSNVGAQVKDALPIREDWLVPTIVQFELAKWIARELEAEKADLAVAFSKKCCVIGLDTGLALAAAEASRCHKLATADAIVYATAQAYNADILTCDAHFEGLPSVMLIAKGPSKA